MVVFSCYKEVFKFLFGTEISIYLLKVYIYILKCSFDIIKCTYPQFGD